MAASFFTGLTTKIERDSSIAESVLEYGEWLVARLRRRSGNPPEVFKDGEKRGLLAMLDVNLGRLALLHYKFGDKSIGKLMAKEYLERFPNGGQKGMARFLMAGTVEESK